MTKQNLPDKSILAIDFGGTSLDAVFYQNSTIQKKTDKSSLAYPATDDSIKNILQEWSIKPDHLDIIAVTGGKSEFLAKDTTYRLTHIPEIQAIGLGGLYLADKPQALVVSLGTGTAMVASTKEKHQHMGGTGLGGGTILGLGKLLCLEDDFPNLEFLAQNGNIKNVDLLVEDIVGQAIGIIPADLTASNFGKISLTESSHYQ
ncbi:MAG TPA: hypothetical protein ENN77_02260, partial [Candidatus Wirthbacteria bacterium]|nr:hypothetical protein [Candidatus Wirthbacteria bacterium]